MKITALLVLKSDASASSSSSAAGEGDSLVLANATDVSHFGYFQRGAAKEFILFVARTVSKRTPPGQRQSVQHEEYKVHSYNRNGLCAVAFMDDHYPIRSAFSLLNKVLDEYQKAFGDSWKVTKTDATQPWPYLTDALTKFQDPAEADKLMKIQRDLDETKIILPLRHGEPHIKPPPKPKEEDESGDEENGDVGEEEQGSALCGSCGTNYGPDEFWICCDVCERWFHGKCVKITPARAEHIKQYKCPDCGSKRARGA